MSTWRASPRAIAPAASAGAVPAQLIPPPHGEDHISWLVPKCSWNAATSKSANAALYVSPSMSAGSSPQSAIARSAASAPISRAVRPDAFVYAVSPMPTIATSPRDVVELGRVAPVGRVPHEGGGYRRRS